MLTAIQPDVIVHLAATSSPAACEKDPDAAMKTNCPMALLKAIQELCPTALLVYTSTDLVFDGEKGNQHSYSYALYRLIAYNPFRSSL
jgi:dTDP-4-dehydrorhamnose reductase